MSLLAQGIVGNLWPEEADVSEGGVEGQLVMSPLRSPGRSLRALVGVELCTLGFK